jgi:hypothetical protein
MTVALTLEAGSGGLVTGREKQEVFPAGSMDEFTPTRNKTSRHRDHQGRTHRQHQRRRTRDDQRRHLGLLHSRPHVGTPPAADA